MIDRRRLSHRSTTARIMAGALACVGTSSGASHAVPTPTPEPIAFCARSWPLATTELACFGGRSTPDTAMDLTPLSRLPHLRELRLESGELEFILTLTIADLSPLGSMKELEVLSIEHAQLGGTPAGELAALAPLTNLVRLALHATNLRDVSPLAQLTRLEQLDLSCTSLSDIGPLATLTQLTRLDLTATHVHDVRALAALTHLTWLGLSPGAAPPEQLDALRRALPALRISEGARD